MEKIEVTCEMEVTLKMIGGKCKPLILEHLITHGTRRFSRLQRSCPRYPSGPSPTSSGSWRRTVFSPAGSIPRCRPG